MCFGSWRSQQAGPIWGDPASMNLTGEGFPTCPPQDTSHDGSTTASHPQASLAQIKSNPLSAGGEAQNDIHCETAMLRGAMLRGWGVGGKAQVPASPWGCVSPAPFLSVYHLQGLVRPVYQFPKCCLPSPRSGCLL